VVKFVGQKDPEGADMTIAREQLLDTRTHCMDLFSEQAAVQSLDLSGSVIDVSPGWLELTGYLHEEVIGRHFIEFLAGESLLKVKENFPCLKDFGYVDNVHLKTRCKDGTIVPVCLNGTSKYSENGQFERTYCEIQPKSICYPD
jgi:PAS domain S-box-containing protein